jgi:hypothetical protein
MKTLLRAISVCLLLFCCLFFLFACGRKTQTEKEPNDTLETANLMRAEIPVTGNISGPDDRDALRFALPAGKLFSFILEHDPQSNLTVEVYRVPRTPQGATVQGAAGTLIKRVDSFIARAGNIITAASPGMVHASFLDGRDNDLVLLIRTAGSGNVYPIPWRLITRLTTADPGIEREPNDTPEQATPINDRQIIEGRYSPAFSAAAPDGFERDFYRFVNTSTNRIILEIEVSGVPNVDAVIEIYDAQGRISRVIDAQGIHHGEVSGPIGLEGLETCIFALRGKHQGNPNASYRVRVHTRMAGPNEEFEPNDSIETANLLIPGEAMQGRIFPEGDVDYFRLPLSAAGRYTISARLSPTGDADLILELLDAQGNVLLSVDDAPAGRAEYIANYGFIALYNDMALFLRVRAKSGARDPGYSIVANRHSAGAFAEFEPNNTRATANPLILDVDMRGYFFPAGDQDWLRFELEQASVLNLNLAAPAGLSAGMRIEDAEGNTVAATPSPAAGEVRLRTPRLEAGSYFLLLAAEEGGNPRDPWVLRVTPEEDANTW